MPRSTRGEMYPPPAPVNGGEARWLWHRELGDVLMFILVAATEGGVGERRTGERGL